MLSIMHEGVQRDLKKIFAGRVSRSQLEVEYPMPALRSCSAGNQVNSAPVSTSASMPGVVNSSCFGLQATTLTLNMLMPQAHHESWRPASGPEIEKLPDKDLNLGHAD